MSLPPAPTAEVVELVARVDRALCDLVRNGRPVKRPGSRLAPWIGHDGRAFRTSPTAAELHLAIRWATLQERVLSGRSKLPDRYVRLADWMQHARKIEEQERMLREGGLGTT